MRTGVEVGGVSVEWGGPSGGVVAMFALVCVVAAGVEGGVGGSVGLPGAIVFFRACMVVFFRGLHGGLQSQG